MSQNEIDLSTLHLEHDSFGRLVLFLAGERHAGIEPVRAFPLSDPNRWVSLCDGHGRELVHIENLDQLSPEARAMVERELSQREFAPVIERIVHISTEGDPAEWTVDTDRGRAKFVLNSEDDLRRITDHRLLITDATGVRYFVNDARALDAASRKRLAKYL